MNPRSWGVPATWTTFHPSWDRILWVKGVGVCRRRVRVVRDETLRRDVLGVFMNFYYIPYEYIVFSLREMWHEPELHSGHPQEQQREQDKRQHKRKQHQEPRKRRSARAADQIQHPGPEQHVQYLDQEQHTDTVHIARIGSQAIDIVVGASEPILNEVIVLKKHHGECHGGND